MKSLENSGHTRRLVTLASAILMLACGTLVGLLAQQRPAAPDLSAAAQAALPQLSGTLSVGGLTQPVEVLRDTWGVPHIYAKNTKDLFFAQGFTVAQDRMWQLEMWRRNGEGRAGRSARAPTTSPATRLHGCSPSAATGTRSSRSTTPTGV